LILVVNKFIFLFFFHYECGPGNIFGFSENKNLIDHQECQSHNQSHNGDDHEDDVGNKIGVCDGSGDGTLGLLGHEDKDDDENGGNGNTDD
jgi:hypothetical protein